MGGITRRLVNISGPEGVVPAREGGVSFWGHEEELIYRNDAMVGSMTSGGYSHTLDRAMGLALINGPPKMAQSWIKEGAYEVQVPGRLSDGRVVSRRVPVEVSTKCLLDPAGVRMKQPVQQAGQVFSQNWIQQGLDVVPDADASPMPPMLKIPRSLGDETTRYHPQQVRQFHSK